MSQNVPNIALNNGVAIPQLGLGVWQAKEGKEVENAVRCALENGYRLIDTAAAYSNEEGVGRAVKNSGVSREDVFVTTKLWNDSHAYDAALRAFDDSLKKLDCDYIDLYLIHWPLPTEGQFPEAWRALGKLYADQKVRAIGVSNFTPQHLEELKKTSDIIPAVNQIELHPKFQQKETRDYCEANGVAVESWSPLMRGGEAFEIPTIEKIARANDKTPAQIILRWHIQSDLIVIPKSVTPERIKENISVFDFSLSDEDMKSIAALDENHRTGADPNTADFK